MSTRLVSRAWIVAALSMAPLAWATEDVEDSRSRYERNVVGLVVTYQGWDEDRPWIKQKPKTRTVAAVVLSGDRLLTTADAFDHTTHVRLETFGRPRPGTPRVLVIDETINLALLAVDGTDAFEGLEPVHVAERTPTSGVLQSVRWRRQQLESVASRVIRIEVARSATARTEHAFLQLRTDMTGGGWSEPVFRDRDLVGITVSQNEQTSRAIPADILHEFLARSESNSSVGFATFGASWQVNRDTPVASALGQSGEPRGVLVRQVPWGSSACGVLKPRDILLEMSGHAIDAEGYYRHPRYGQLAFGHILAEEHAPGDPVPLRILRGGREIEVAMTARTYPSAIDRVPARRDARPPYLIVGGLVLRELDLPYLRTWGDEWEKVAPASLLSRYYYGQESQTPTARRFVLIASVIPTSFNLGYHDLRDEILDRVNGRPIGRLEDVVEALKRPQDGFHLLELSDDSGRELVVLDAVGLEAATAECLRDYGVASAVELAPAELPPLGGDCPGDF